ncbi:TRM32-like protein [Actinidia rufa]|uniref:TRM32-like protein n=1 Tax=Actinidia rufa TaxID=165716 RepID=A0A7J0DN55_9ERIC|nr:TRM32-like protein [Actinidia rufa]
MGKHSRTEPVDDLFEDNHPSCMWGILHALDYHHWQYNVRKMLPHKKHCGSRHAKGNGRPKIRLNVPDSDEDQELLGAEIDPSTTETSATNKRSLKARIKALISQDPSDTPPRGKSNGWSHRFIFLYRHAVNDHMKGSKKTVTCNEKFNVGGAENVFDYLEHKRPSENHTLYLEKCMEAKEISVNQKHVEGKERCVDASCQCKEYGDVLEIFRVNKDTDNVLANCFRNLQASNARARLTKSGSFPAADFSHSRKFRPSKLKHKQNEVWSFPKGEKLFAPKLSKDIHTKSELLMVNDTGGEVLNQDLYFSSMDSTKGSDTQENSKVVIDRVEDDNSSICHEIDGSAYNLNKVKPTRVRRTSSLSGSLERYAQLLQNSSSREAKLQVSKSLKLSNEYEIPSGGHAPTSFKRFQSLPHLDSYGSLQNELSWDAHVSRIETRTVVDSSKNVVSESHDEPKPVNIPFSTEKYVPLEANRETEFVCNIVERSHSSLKNEHVASVTESTNEHAISEMLSLGEEMEEQTVKESNLEKEKEVTLRETASGRLPQPRPVSVLQSCSQEDVISPNDFPASEDLDCKFSDVDETESSVDPQYRSSSDALTWSCSIANPESFRIANKSVENHRQNNADFDYVSDILERSGFNRTGFLGQWHSLDQPLNPLVFEEAEACWPHEPQRYGDEIFSSCHHQLLFDLINEVMVQIYDTSFTYYPKVLSVNCRIPPISPKYNIVDDAWARISRTLSSRQGVDQSMDCVVAQDFGKDDGWMNLQLETECVGLELEDIIFDELLEEILCS